jgi:serine/threonine protein kinase/tetratricopeptide (TPR) repeat protein
LIGKTLSNFKITAKLGEGGMGEVYRAEDTELGREVAIKVLPEAVATDPDRLARFQREAKTLAALDHPNIVHIYSVGSAMVEDRPVHFLTMQLVKGRPLSDLITGSGLPLDDIFRIAEPLADALVAAHRASIIHRDLKPANIMVTDEGRVRILDFGLAKWLQEAAVPEASELPTRTLTQEGSIVGTVPYMSPEQLEGKELDGRSDIFSLGVILYEMATGQRPFQGESSASLIFSIMKDIPDDIDNLRTDLPHHLGRVVRRCLEKEPDRRYQAALDVHNEFRDLQREFDSAVASGSQVSTPRTEIGVAKHPGPSHRGLWLALAAIVLLGAGLAYWAGRERGRPETLKAPQQSVSAHHEKTTSIAVLPFVDMSPDKDQEYFSDGLSEELLNLLVGIDGLKVAARTSSFSFKHKDVEITQIAQELRVQNILEGSVRKAGEQLRVTAQLINAEDGFHLWSDTYDRHLDDIFAVQDEIARAVVDSLQLTLLGDTAEADTSRSDSAEAYNLYLQGKFFAQRRAVPEDFVRAINYLERAVALDPDYALAWAGLAYALNNQAEQGYADLEEGRIAAIGAVERALELNPDLAYAWAVLGEIRNELEWNWKGAHEALEKAQRLSPEDPAIMRRRSELALRMGKNDLAIELAQEAADLDPLSHLPYAVLARANQHAQRWDEALAASDKILEIQPGYPTEVIRRIQIELSRGRPEAALELLESEAEQGPLDILRAMALYATGRPSEARDLLERAVASPDSSPMHIAEAFAYIESPDMAFDWLDRAFREHDSSLGLTKTNPLLANLHDDPRWHRFLKKMGLAQ